MLHIKVQNATDMFTSGHNCAQSVLGVFCEDYGLQRETAFQIACGLGSGFRSAEICGAVSGAVLVIGLKYGKSKSLCNSKTEEFINRFRCENHDIVCRNLLQCDISTPEGRQKAISENLFKTTCVEMVQSAANILIELGY